LTSSAPVVITPAVETTSMVNELTAEQARMAKLESEISTGHAVITASDDPAQASNILQLQASVTRANQFAANAQDGASWLSLGNSTLSSVMDVLQNVQSAVAGLTGDLLSGTQSAVAGVATVVTGALQQLIDLANTQYGGQAIFSGTGDPTQAYSTTGVYLGAGNAPTRTVAPGTLVSVSVTGPAVFGTGTTGLLSKVPGNLGVLAQIAADLSSGTPARLESAATTGLGALEAAMSRVAAQAAKLGADEQAMQGFSSQATASATALTEELSNAQDVNIAQAITDLQLQQSSYQAALSVISKVSADSLAQYLS
jgi:flagellar hook-associated protein 3 FlgL